jgi:hypothetical protein
MQRVFLGCEVVSGGSVRTKNPKFGTLALALMTAIHKPFRNTIKYLENPPTTFSVTLSNMASRHVGPITPILCLRTCQQAVPAFAAVNFTRS